RDLPEVVAGTEHAARAEVALADGEHAGEDDVEAVAGVALAHEHGAGRDLFPLHASREPAEDLAREPGKQLDAGEPVLGCGSARHGLAPSSVHPLLPQKTDWVHPSAKLSRTAHRHCPLSCRSCAQ